MKNSGKIINRCLCWVGVMAMLTHMIVPFAWGMPATAFAGGYGNGMSPPVISSAMDEAVQFSVNGNSKAPYNQPLPRSCEFCLTCHSWCHKVILSAPVAIQKAVALVYSRRVDGTRIPGWLPTRHRQRAPPLFT